MHRREDAICPEHMKFDLEGNRVFRASQPRGEIPQLGLELSATTCLALAIPALGAR